MNRLDPAAAGVVAALEDDPFYISICAGHAGNDQERRAVLGHYFSYSIGEGKEIGRVVHLPDPAKGVAVWHLPQADDVTARASAKKRAFLEQTLDPVGCANYHRMVEFMSAQAEKVVPGDAWYLSIIAVAPALQGQGRGVQLLRPTLEEADQAKAVCYLETFSRRNLSFYERLGFITQARFVEPTSRAEYAVMVRPVRSA